MAILVLRTGPSLTTAAREAGCWGPRGRSVSRSALKEPSAPPTAPHPGGPDASVRLIGLSYSGVPGNSVWGDDRRCLKKKTEFHGQLCENLHLNCSLSLEIHHACPILLPLRSLIRREVDSLCLMPFSGLAQTPPPPFSMHLPETLLQRTNMPPGSCSEPFSDSHLLSGWGEISSTWRTRLGPGGPALSFLAATSLHSVLCSLGCHSLATWTWCGPSCHRTFSQASLSVENSLVRPPPQSPVTPPQLPSALLSLS